MMPFFDTMPQSAKEGRWLAVQDSRRDCVVAFCNRPEYFIDDASAEEGYMREELALMHSWDDNLENPIAEGYIRSGNIITSVSYEFVRWAIAFGELIGIEASPRMFGL